MAMNSDEMDPRLFQIGFRKLERDGHTEEDIMAMPVADVLDAARHGVWSLHHGCNERYRGGPAFFWEIFRDDPVSATVLQVLNDQLDAGQVIYKSWAATYRFSLFISRNAAFWKSSDFHLRRLRDLHQRGWAWIADQEAARATYDYSTPINRYPTNGQMLVFAARLAGRILHQAWTKATTRTQWFLAIRPRDAADAGGWRTIRPPAERFWADPQALYTPEQELHLVEEPPPVVCPTAPAARRRGGRWGPELAARPSILGRSACALHAGTGVPLRRGAALPNGARSDRGMRDR